MGTAFHLDGWGTLFTADHVVDHIRARHLKELQPNAVIEVDFAQSTHATVLLGYGLVYGIATIPEECWAPIQRVEAIVQQHDDPLARLRGESDYRAVADIAGLSVLLHPKASIPHSLPVDFRWQPTVGERVFAVGYPELGFEPLQPDAVGEFLKEGLHGAYGSIINLFPQGRGKSRPTPGFEVATDWPAGMSGGPVLNECGHVIGIVSSSLAPSDNEAGVAFAASLGWIPEAPGLAPTLDKDNPGYRLGFGVFKKSPWHLAGVFPTCELAEKSAAASENGYQIAWGSHLLGSDTFLVLDS